MKKLLLTGFEAFLQNEKNPTEEIVRALHNKEMVNWSIEGLVLPVVFEEAAKQIIKKLSESNYDAIIMMGLAASRKEITPERIAINCRDGGHPDNIGNRYIGSPIKIDGPDGIFTTLPIQKMVTQLKEKEIPASISNSAGTYVCNDTMYLVNLYIKENKLQIPSGFIHVPQVSTEEEFKQLVDGMIGCIEVLE